MIQEMKKWNRQLEIEDQVYYIVHALLLGWLIQVFGIVYYYVQMAEYVLYGEAFLSSLTVLNSALLLGLFSLVAYNYTARSLPLAAKAFVWYLRGEN